ncbi:PEP-utilizing enzyme [Rhodococcus sp. NPDC056960]|uniref:PEP-utilizing enzyme n=1 Tax=Rhodococcus sp. NPDC056960 TaxID=3345982 RepID=UPI003635A9E3
MDPLRGVHRPERLRPRHPARIRRLRREPGFLHTDHPTPSSTNGHDGAPATNTWNGAIRASETSTPTAPCCRACLPARTRQPGPSGVIHDPDQADELEPCEILVAPGTDPSWTPLCVSSAAVVVDVGAPMSHAAIVSRELGISCVVSCTYALRRITNGTVITVDGAAGAVTIGH